MKSVQLLHDVGADSFVRSKDSIFETVVRAWAGDSFAERTS